MKDIIKYHLHLANIDFYRITKPVFEILSQNFFRNNYVNKTSKSNYKSYNLT